METRYFVGRQTVTPGAAPRGISQLQGDSGTSCLMRSASIPFWEHTLPVIQNEPASEIRLPTLVVRRAWARDFLRGPERARLRA